MEGNVIIYKARLVEKDIIKCKELTLMKLFLVALLKFIRILLAIAAHYDYEIRQMDVKTTFLNGNLSEEVYVTA